MMEPARKVPSCTACRSDPQMPQLWTFRTTSPAPAFGTGASMMPTRFCFWNAAAFILMALLLDQLDFVTVGILDERDHRAAMLHRARVAHHPHALRLQIRARLVCVGHADREMPERIALVVALGAPVMGQLDDGVILLVAVADEGEGELA